MLVPRIRQPTAIVRLPAVPRPVSGMWRYALVASVGVWGLVGSMLALGLVR